jgi:hypothetical protein
MVQYPPGTCYNSTDIPNVTNTTRISGYVPKR